MAILRERVPRPATRNLTRGEVLGVIGLTGSMIGFAILINDKVSPTPPSTTGCDCAVQCPCESTVL